MRLLLETHALLWWAKDDKRLSRRARLLLSNTKNELLLSSASAFEIATKHRLGKLPEAGQLAKDIAGWIGRLGLVELPISVAHAQMAGDFASAHRDPFDRILAAQGVIENVPILGCDEALLELGAQLIW